MQEGYHLEADTPEDDFTYKGVVFNEMKVPPLKHLWVAGSGCAVRVTTCPGTSTCPYTCGLHLDLHAHPTIAGGLLSTRRHPLSSVPDEPFCGPEGV